jgi:hypothetical protein
VKRDVRLRALSRDHHHGLVLARYIAALCARDCVDADAVGVVKERFDAEIRPHMAIEEVLLNALEGRGVDELVTRTREEHAAMLRLLDRASTTELPCLIELASLLERHIRFEEHELYPACERVLSDAALQRIASLHEGAR